MKKYIFAMGIIMISLLIVSIKPTYGLTKNDVEVNINSNELLTYIKEKEIKNITKLCTVDFCDYMRSLNTEKAVEIFKKKYQNFIEEKTSEEVALSTILKGFTITTIEYSH